MGLCTIPLFSLSPSSEKKDCTPESTNTVVSTMTVPTSIYLNGATPSPNPPSLADCHPTDSLIEQEEPEAQPAVFTRIPSHQLLSMHQILSMEEDGAGGQGARLAERPVGELIAAGEC